MTATTPLTCDGFANALADYLERDDTPRVRAAVEAHAASCAACGALLADVQQLRVDASGLPTLTPPRDLWAGVAERIATPVVAIGAGREERRQTGRAAWLRPVAAAAALVIMTAGVTYLATREALEQDAQVAGRPIDSATIDPRLEVARANDSARRVDGAATRVAAMPSDPTEMAAGASTRPEGTRPPPASRVPAFLASDQPVAATLETVYGREIARLRRIIDERRALLDTATVGVIERNLTIIDQAIRESRAALARDPASALLNEQLNNALEQKVELLRAAVLLPVRS
ncbi:MAG: zf-HC2 domain-containing protein [Gemmatimonadota bacterium]|nr:zf-HC2 domain-containing protein [Gemmatimonadota bacterium]